MPRKTATRKPKAVKAKTKTAVRRTAAAAPRGNNLRKRTEELAYELFRRRGYQHGWDGYDWSMAETLAKLESGSAARKSARKSPSPELVQKKAYEIFAGRGYTHGSDDADWFLAENFVRYEQN